MQITYVAKHRQECSNDDEGSIAYALQQLGHSVFCMNEGEAHHLHKSKYRDLLLFHKWEASNLANPNVRDRFGKIAFWYFDLVLCDDPTLRKRCDTRVGWMHRVLPWVDLGFCTDGDWVATAGTHPAIGEHSAKLRWLCQGADERVIGQGEARCRCCNQAYEGPPILLTGISKGGGKLRESFISELQERWGSQFLHIERGVHGRDMAHLIAQSKIVVCPDYPVTDRYWSNRVWNALGFGAFVLHPYCRGLEEMIGVDSADRAPLLTYQSRQHLHELIRDYLQLPTSRSLTALAGLEAVKAAHTYQHRCQQLMQVIQEHKR